MYRTPSKRGGGSDHNSPRKVPLKGLFQDGVWHCNCSPRLPASHFQVRKEGSNKGRWFYTCQEPKDSGCGFFLWDEDAAPREMKAVTSNSRTEPNMETNSSPTTTRHNMGSGSRSIGGDVADIGKKDEEEFADWPLEADEELVVNKLLDGPTETPKKYVSALGMTTPASKRKRDDEAWPTPTTGEQTSRKLFRSIDDTRTASKRLKGGMWDGNENTGSLLSPSVTPAPQRIKNNPVASTSWSLLSPLETPTSMRFRDVSEDIGVVRDMQDSEICVEVLELLADSNLDDDISTKLRKLLNKYALKTQGITKGRDITRLALKTKDAKIDGLQQRISALETEREMDKNVIRHFKSDMAHSVSSRGRVRSRASR